MPKRREFLQAGGVMGVAGIVGAAVGNPVKSFAAKNPVLTEMERRLKFLSPPQGTPPDLLAQPSPPVKPFQELTLAEFRPPVAKPLFSLTGPVLTGELDTFTPGQLIENLSDDDWWQVFQARFRKTQIALSQEGFLPPDELATDELWSVRGDQLVNGRIKIDIGDLPRPDRHQRFWELRPHAFYINREVEFRWDYHPQMERTKGR